MVIENGQIKVIGGNPLHVAYLIQKFLCAIVGRFLDLQQNKYRFVALIG